MKTLTYQDYVPSFGEWGFFLAAERDLAAVDVQREVPIRFLAAEVFQNSQVFFPDIAEIPAWVNTLDS